MAIGLYVNKNSVYAMYRVQQNGNRKNLIYYTNIIIQEPLQWNPENQSTGDIDTDYKLASIKKAIKDITSEVNPFSLNSESFSKLIEERISPKHKKKEKQNPFFNYCDRYFNEKQVEVGDRNAMNIRTTIRKLRQYNPNLTFEAINDEFYREFVRWWRKQVKPNKDPKVIEYYSDNYISRQIVNLKRILNQAVRDRVNKNLDFREFERLDEDVYNVYLTEQQIEAIYNLKFPLSDNPKADFLKYFGRKAPDFTDKKIRNEVEKKAEALERCRKLTVIGCWTGLRCENYLAIDPDIQVTEDGRFIEAIANKNGPRLTIPLHRLVREIIKDGWPETISAKAMNEHIKDIGRLAGLTRLVIYARTQGGKRIQQSKPFYQMMVTHTCRRSFCSNLTKRGVPMQFSMSVSGHSTEKSFRKYIAAVLKEELSRQLADYPIWD